MGKLDGSLFISAGHYVPQLAKRIHNYNKAYSRPIINLKGFIVSIKTKQFLNFTYSNEKKKKSYSYTYMSIYVCIYTHR